MSRPDQIARDQIDNLAALFAGSSAVSCTDAELLDRFVAGSDAELAFASIVERHGSLVWGVCRRILANVTDAEDAFQTTFLVLVRQARSVRVDDSLGRWLYGVSRRVASRIRSDRERRRRRESVGSLPDRPGPSLPGLHVKETFAALDAEVARLPERFRSAVVLCDLGGVTQEQAALELGCAVGTIKSRLARGRARLRDRLVRRGFDDAAMASLIRLANPSVELVRATVRGVMAASSGPLLASMVVSGSLSFKDGVGPMLLTLRLPWLVGTAALATIGLTGWNWQAADDRPGDPVAQVTAPTAHAATPDQGATTPQAAARSVLPEYIVEPPDTLAVEVREALPDRPISGERLVRPDGKISLGFYGEVHVAGLTTTQVKEQVVKHLRQYLSDNALGLKQVKDETTVKVEPARTTKVFVDVVKYNSKVYYVQGDVGTPGRLPITGNETVLDAITFAGGLIPTAQGAITIRLVRPAPRGECCEQVMPIDFKAIVEQADMKTNYAIRAGDRIVVYRDPQGPTSPARPTSPLDPQTIKTAARGDAVPGVTLNLGQSVKPQGPPAAGNIAREFAMQSLPEYVVEPPDMIKVEVLDALPGQPIKGERLVQPDGRITLGYYGQVYVAGLTLNEIKEKVTQHLRSYLTDAALGLTQDSDGKINKADLGKTTRVAVEMSRYNSKVYYVQGQVGSPGRLNITGNDTVLDALNYAGGLVPSRSKPVIRLARPAPPGTAAGLILPVDLPAILDRGDVSTNYQLMPGDRLIVSQESASSPAIPQPEPINPAEARVREIERKLDLILKKLEIDTRP